MDTGRIIIYTDSRKLIDKISIDYNKMSEYIKEAGGTNRAVHDSCIFLLL